MDQIVSVPEVRKRGQPRIPEEKKRVPLHVRVMPSTREFLKRAGAKNNGRAVDMVVSAYRRLAAKMKALEKN
jgi:uncharacterized protein (DUF1778 family)